MKGPDTKSLFYSKFSLFTNFSPLNNPNSTLQETLERAQNALYYKEIYNQVKKET